MRQEKEKKKDIVDFDDDKIRRSEKRRRDLERRRNKFEKGGEKERE